MHPAPLVYSDLLVQVHLPHDIVSLLKLLSVADQLVMGVVKELDPQAHLNEVARGRNRRLLSGN